MNCSNRSAASRNRFNSNSHTPSRYVACSRTVAGTAASLDCMFCHRRLNNVAACSYCSDATWIPAEHLTYGTLYQLVVSTPDGRNYVSDYEELLPCPPIDSILWERKPLPTTDPNLTYNGVQFYVSTDASGDYAKHFRWDLEETWEYHAATTINAFYIGGEDIRDIIVPAADTATQIWSGWKEDTLFYCWKTLSIPEIFTYTTQNLSSDLVRKFPLNHVSNRTDRLEYRYHLLVKQY